MDRRALLRTLDPIERNVLLLWLRLRRVDLVAEALDGAVGWYEDSNSPRKATILSVTEDGRHAPVNLGLSNAEVEEILGRARAKLEVAARQYRFRAERERPTKEVVMSNGQAPGTTERTLGGHPDDIPDPILRESEPGVPTESWGNRVLREAKERRERLVAEVLPKLDEILEAEAVLAALEIRPVWTVPNYEKVIDFGQTIVIGPEDEEVVEAEVPEEPDEPSGPEGEPPAASEEEAYAGLPEVEEKPAEPETAGEQAEEPERIDVPVKRKETPAAAKARERVETVVGYLRENGPTPRRKVGEDLSIPSGSWGTLLPRLAEQGVDSTVLGGNGSAKVSILHLEGQDPEGEEAEPVPPPRPPSAPELTAEMVRDAIVANPRIRRAGKVFAAVDLVDWIPSEVRQGYATPRDLAAAILDVLPRFVGTVVERVSQMGNENRFRYLDHVDEPTPVRSDGGGPGPEVEFIDRRGPGQGRGRTVKGTGRPPKSASPEVNGLIRKVRECGGTTEHDGHHILVRLPTGTCRIASTPSSPSGFRDDRQKLRRLGVPV